MLSTTNSHKLPPGFSQSGFDLLRSIGFPNEDHPVVVKLDARESGCTDHGVDNDVSGGVDLGFHGVGYRNRKNPRLSFFTKNGVCRFHVIRSTVDSGVTGRITSGSEWSDSP